MCDIIAIDDQQPHIAVVDVSNDTINIVSIVDIRRIANSSASIAEFDDPEQLARCLAIALIERL